MVVDGCYATKLVLQPTLSRRAFPEGLFEALKSVAQQTKGWVIFALNIKFLESISVVSQAREQTEKTYVRGRFGHGVRVLVSRAAM